MYYASMPINFIVNYYNNIFINTCLHAYQISVHFNTTQSCESSVKMLKVSPLTVLYKT